MLRKKSSTLAVETPNVFTYIGMYFEINEDVKYYIGMYDYIVKTFEVHMKGKGRQFEKGLKVLEGKDLHELLEGNMLTRVSKSKQFHSTTVRMIYVTNLTNPTCKGTY